MKKINFYIIILLCCFSFRAWHTLQQPSKNKLDITPLASEDAITQVIAKNQLTSPVNNVIEQTLQQYQKYELKVHQLKQSSASTQILFKQYHEGLEIHPHGNLTLDLNAAGKIIKSYVDLVDQPAPQNPVLINRETAWQIAQSYSDHELPSPNDASSLQDIIWARHDISTKETRAYRAYLYQSMDQRMVIRADNGKILQRRDPRHY